MAAACAACISSTASAGPDKNYVWRGWKMTDTDYAIVHALPKDPLDNDFYLICYGKRGEMDLDIRALDAGGYKLEAEKDVPTVFVIGKTRLPVTAAGRGPAENGGISMTYRLTPDSPVVAAMTRGEAFRVELPKAGTQLFSPKSAVRFFKEMASHCKKPAGQAGD